MKSKNKIMPLMIGAAMTLAVANVSFANTDSAVKLKATVGKEQTVSDQKKTDVKAEKKEEVTVVYGRIKKIEKDKLEIETAASEEKQEAETSDQKDKKEAETKDQKDKKEAETKDQKDKKEAEGKDQKILLTLDGKTEKISIEKDTKLVKLKKTVKKEELKEGDIVKITVDKEKKAAEIEVLTTAKISEKVNAKTEKNADQKEEKKTDTKSK